MGWRHKDAAASDLVLRGSASGCLLCCLETGGKPAASWQWSRQLYSVQCAAARNSDDCARSCQAAADLACLLQARVFQAMRGLEPDSTAIIGNCHGVPAGFFLPAVLVFFHPGSSDAGRGQGRDPDGRWRLWVQDKPYRDRALCPTALKGSCEAFPGPVTSVVLPSAFVRQTALQSRITLPVWPPAMALKASSKRLTGKRWVITGSRSSPDCNRLLILYQVSKISRP